MVGGHPATRADETPGARSGAAVMGPQPRYDANSVVQVHADQDAGDRPMVTYPRRANPGRAASAVYPNGH